MECTTVHWVPSKWNWRRHKWPKYLNCANVTFSVENVASEYRPSKLSLNQECTVTDVTYRSDSVFFVWLNQYCWLRKDFHIGVCSLGKSQHNWSEIHTWNDSSAMQARRNRGAERASAPQSTKFLADQLSFEKASCKNQFRWTGFSTYKDQSRRQ